MTARTRRRLAAASFGPEWRPLSRGGLYALLDGEPPRAVARALAHLRAARRDLAAAEARWEAARDAELDRALLGPSGVRGPSVLCTWLDEGSDFPPVRPASAGAFVYAGDLDDTPAGYFTRTAPATAQESP